MKKEIKYLAGLGNYFETQCLEGALPTDRNCPQKPPYGLVSEQINGSAFTAPRSENLKTWFYRIRPSVLHSKFDLMPSGFLRSGPFGETPSSPNQMRWDPISNAKESADFIEGFYTMAGNGDVETQKGCGVHLYHCSKPMEDKFFYDADGELLILPESGAMYFETEMGRLEVGVGEVVVIPRGIKFRASPLDKTSRGYICENYGAPFRLPALGPIGANGLANARHFLSPTASYEDKAGSFQLITKYQGELWKAEIKHSPLDVVAWSGNYAPYKYDLKLFNTINTVSFDHPDPSIFTVLTSPSETAGVANLDFVIFPPRWMVAENTFRPPYYHRNFMSEFMGLIYGEYDAKPSGFVPGGCSLHNCMSAHGPDADTYTRASEAELKPVYLKDTLAFMFESRYVFHATAYAQQTKSLQKDYLGCWREIKSQFNPNERGGN